MLDSLQALIGDWGYLGFLAFVLLGNLGLPVPEETILWLAGYLVWKGGFELPVVLLVGIVGAVGGDCLGYYIGRRYGQRTVARYGLWSRLTPTQIESMRRFVIRFGPFGVFAARFVVGLRVLAGPLAGSLDLPWRSFLAANILGALCYVPLMVGAGYAVGYGLGEQVDRIQRGVAQAQTTVWLGVALCGLCFLGYRAVQRRRETPDA